MSVLLDPYPPALVRSPCCSLHAYVSRLRRALGSDRVVRSGNGYKLVLRPDELDVDRFERLLASGRDQHRAGDVERAAETLRRALAPNTVTSEVPIGHAVALATGRQAVWVSDSRGQVWRINPVTATVTQTTPVGRGLVGLCATDGMVFAANNADGTVVQIDARDGRVVGLVPVGHAPTDVTSQDGIVWLSIQSESAM